ncbi:MAG: class I SAM-dependent methyltransferase [Vicinamibacteraceae bacterium]
MHRCTSCGSGYLDPRPTPETLGLAYREYYTHKQKPDFESLDRVSKMRRALANGYRHWRFGTADAPGSRLGVLMLVMSPRYRAKVDATMRHLPKPRPGQRLLDVGCGNGTFLVRARSAGWTVVGVDLDSNAVTVGRQQGLDVRLGSVDTLDPAIEHFDVITLSHVIEHAHEPTGMLRACRSLLRRGGSIWIDTPNIDADGHRHFGADWLGLDPPRHLVLFSLGSLQRALSISGFAEMDVQPYRPLCATLFRASTAIAQGIGPYSKEGLKMPLPPDVEKSERIAKRTPARREYITVKARTE